VSLNESPNWKILSKESFSCWEAKGNAKPLETGLTTEKSATKRKNKEDPDDFVAIVRTTKELESEVKGK